MLKKLLIRTVLDRDEAGDTAGVELGKHQMMARWLAGLIIGLSKGSALSALLLVASYTGSGWDPVSQVVAVEGPLPLRAGDWAVSQSGSIERWSSNRPELAGGALFKRPESTADVRSALLSALSSEGYGSIQIAGQHPVTQIRLMDQQGTGVAFSGSAQRGGQPVQFAAVVLYGTLDGSPRVSTVYGFAAPPALARRMGGWVPVAAAWLGLSSEEVSHLLIPQGESAAGSQAQTLAAVTDYFFEDMTTALGLYMFNITSVTNQFMMDYMCTGVVGVEDVFFGSSDC